MEERDDTSFVKDSKIALLGTINGIVFYDWVWAFIIITIIKLVMGDSYAPFIDNNYNFMTIILMILSSILTLVLSIVIANPSYFFKAYKKIRLSDFKFIFKCLGLMILFNYVYNFILLLCNVDIVGGNANQSAVMDLIKTTPILSFFSMVLLAPILEEVTYRYFLYGGIAKYNRKLAIVLSGFIFMCVHATASFSKGMDNIFRELILLPPYMFSGMVLAYAYDKKSNLLTSTSIHALNNFISFILCML